MDDRDEQILSLLQADAWLSFVDLARQVHLSASAVQRRVERLKQEGVLLSAHARLARQSRMPLRVYALVELTDDREATVERFRRQIEKTACVIEAYYVTGETDVVLTLDVVDMDAYNEFVRRHFSTSPLVKRFKSLTGLRSLKAVAA